jgi:hypothetical protein
MLAQTPVQIAWVTSNLDATEAALTGVSVPEAGVPYLEIAYVSPDIQRFYDYVKQEQE